MSESLVYVGAGDLGGCGVYARRDIKKGETVVPYRLMELTEEEFLLLPESEQEFTHRHFGKTMLYGIPERYVNHSDQPNTIQDFDRGCDVACRDISKGEMVTTDSAKDDIGTDADGAGSQQTVGGDA